MHVCPGNAVRGLLPTVFPSAAFSLELPIPNFSSVDALREDAAKQSGLSAEFSEFSSHAATSYPVALKAHCENVRRISFDVFPSRKTGIKENVLNMRPPCNKYVHRINMTVPAGVSVQPEFKKSRLHASRIRFPSHEIEMGCAREPYIEPFMRSWLRNGPHEFVTDTFCECQPFC